MLRSESTICRTLSARVFENTVKKHQISMPQIIILIALSNAEKGIASSQFDWFVHKRNLKPFALLTLRTIITGFVI